MPNTIKKTILHPQGDSSVDIYPKTSFDQVEGSLGIERTTGEMPIGRIPDIPSSKVTGNFDASRITNKVSYMHNICLIITGTDVVTNKDVYAYVMLSLFSKSAAPIENYSDFNTLFSNYKNKNLHGYGYFSLEDGNNNFDYYNLASIIVYDNTIIDLVGFFENSSADVFNVEVRNDTNFNVYYDDVTYIY